MHSSYSARACARFDSLLANACFQARKKRRLEVTEGQDNRRAGLPWFVACVYYIQRRVVRVVRLHLFVGSFSMFDNLAFNPLSATI